jgi:poly(A) polymerase
MTDAVLSNADWLHSDALKAVVAALSVDAVPPRIVGGAVRDGLLGLPVSDVDLATMLHPKDTAQRLEDRRIKAVPTGIDHGTITAVVDGHRYEVTTLRRDVSTDGRRATVAFSTDWKVDAARRDFTINALYADPTSGAVYDYFGGLGDLEIGLVRFIGDATMRIAEDHLRILRFFRFYARFGKGGPDAEAIAACEAAAKSLMALSRERIAEELMKLLALPNPADSIALMIKHNIFAAFLPELHPDAVERLLRLIQREQQAAIAPKATRRFNALLPDDRTIVDLVSSRLKMSNKIRTEMCECLSASRPDNASPRALAYRHGVALAKDMILLHGLAEDWQSALAQLADWSPPVFPVTGGSLVGRGLNAGPVVAKTLRLAEQMWIDEGFPGAERAQAIADQLVADRLSAKNP